MRAGSKLVGYGQFFRQVAVKNVVGVIFNAGEEVIIGRAEQFVDGWHVFAAVPQPLAMSQQWVETRTIGCVLDPRDDGGSEDVMKRRRRRAMGAQYPHGVHQTGACRQQCAHVVSSREPVVHHDAKNSQAVNWRYELTREFPHPAIYTSM